MSRKAVPVACMYRRSYLHVLFWSASLCVKKVLTSPFPFFPGQDNIDDARAFIHESQTGSVSTTSLMLQRLSSFVQSCCVHLFIWPLLLQKVLFSWHLSTEFSCFRVLRITHTEVSTEMGPWDWSLRCVPDNRQGYVKVQEALTNSQAEDPKLYYLCTRPCNLSCSFLVPLWKPSMEKCLMNQRKHVFFNHDDDRDLPPAASSSFRRFSSSYASSKSWSLSLRSANTCSWRI